MRKSIIIGACSVLLLSSCGSTAGEGAFNGAMLGGWFGSAIGGIIGGHYGHDVGTVVGMATGAVIGAENGAQEEQKRAERYERIRERRHQRGINRRDDRDYDRNYDSGFDETNSGDDRIELESSVAESSSTVFELKNVRFTDANGDGVLQRSEVGRISFEIKNVTSQMQYDVIPAVVECTGNSHILISPSAHIENILPGQTLRYTAMVVADGSLKDGNVSFEVSVSLDGRTQGEPLSIQVATSKTKVEK